MSRPFFIVKKTAISIIFCTFASMKMKRLFLLFLLVVMANVSALAQYDFLTAHRGVIKGGYDFWVYQSRRYGPLDAIVRGREIPALVIVPQNPGGSWNPKKVLDVLDWTRQHYPCDSTRVYVLGMSLGGYGTMDFAGTYPDRVAAALAMCGGSTLRDVQPLGQVPLWIIHGTADRAVSITTVACATTGGRVPTTVLLPVCSI